jgi:hypothetical protein
MDCRRTLGGQGVKDVPQDALNFRATAQYSAEGRDHAGISRLYGIKNRMSITAVHTMTSRRRTISLHELPRACAHNHCRGTARVLLHDETGAAQNRSDNRTCGADRGEL